MNGHSLGLTTLKGLLTFRYCMLVEHTWWRGEFVSSFSPDPRVRHTVWGNTASLFPVSARIHVFVIPCGVWLWRGPSPGPSHMESLSPQYRDTLPPRQKEKQDCASKCSHNKSANNCAAYRERLRLGLHSFQLGLTWICKLFKDRWCLVFLLYFCSSILLLNIPPLIVMSCLAFMIGLTVLAYYSMIQCDPLASGQIGNPNQAKSTYLYFQ